MRPDIAELRAFYGSRQGQLARRLVNTQLRQLWPDLAGRTVAGIGYPLPFLGMFDEAAAVAALLTADMAHAAGEDEANGCVVVGHEEDLPFADGSLDRVLLAHALETSPKVKRLMREVWRVLADGGRLVAIVPNRRGVWCWSERTPFGMGQPYSAGQLERTLRSHLFEPTATRRALYLPPTRWRLPLRFAIPVERLGLRVAPQLAGVVLVEAEKRLYVPAPVTTGKRAARRRYAAVPQRALADCAFDPPAPLSPSADAPAPPSR